MLLCEQDGAEYQQRRWYEQFDVAPDMVDRFEYELDTTRPVASWRREVADNLARRS